MTLLRIRFLAVMTTTKSKLLVIRNSLLPAVMVKILNRAL